MKTVQIGQFNWLNHASITSVKYEPKTQTKTGERLVIMVAGAACIVTDAEYIRIAARDIAPEIAEAIGE